MMKWLRSVLDFLAAMGPPAPMAVSLPEKRGYPADQSDFMTALEVERRNSVDGSPIDGSIGSMVNFGYALELVEPPAFVLRRRNLAYPEDGC
jgi:hypothetical protein